MKINREKLLNQLESVLPGLSPREIIEQSSCFIFKDKKVMTYNDEVACSQKCSLDIKGAIQAMPLVEILRKLKEDSLDIETTKSEILIKGKKRKAGIRLEQEILLPVETVEQPKHWKKLHKDFTDAVSIVQECSGKDETQFAMTCIHIHPKYIEACDNYQVTRYKLKTEIDKSFLVRRESVKYIVSLDMNEFSETKTWVHFRNLNGLVISCRRYMEEYPDVSKILDVSGEPTILPKGLKDAAERAEIFSKETPENDRVTIDLQANKLKITGTGVSGWFSEFKNVKYKGQFLSFTISPKLLIQLVQRHNECEITRDRLKVDGGKFVYITALGRVKPPKDKGLKILQGQDNKNDNFNKRTSTKIKKIS